MALAGEDKGNGKHMNYLYRSVAAPIIPFLCLLFPLEVFAESSLPEIVKKTAASTVVILTYDKDGQSLAQGSGFFINKEGDVITNYHVLEGASRAEVKGSDGKVYPIKLVIAQDKEYDLIRVSTGIPQESVLELSASIPDAGERIAVIGSPMGLEQTVSDGIVSAVRDVPSFGKIYQITAPISPGSSGSPVVNTRGEVIGIATFQLLEGQNLNFAVPAEEIVKLEKTQTMTLNEFVVAEQKKNGDDTQELLLAGMQFQFNHQYEEAISCFEKLTKKDPRNSFAYFEIGMCNSILERNQEAIEALQESIRIDQNYAPAHRQLGIIYVRLQRFKEAIESYKTSLRIDPDNADAHCNLGLAYASSGRHEEAIAAYKNSIRIDPDVAAAHYHLGRAYETLGRHNEAVTAFKNSIALDPEDPRPYCIMGMSYGLLGRYDEAIEAYKNSIRVDPTLAPPYYQLGLTYVVIGDTGSALEQYRILKDLDNDLAIKLFNLIYK